MNDNPHHHTEDPSESNGSGLPLVDKPGIDQHEHPYPDRHGLVQVTADGVAKSIKKGKYMVADLKIEIGVASDLELDQVVDGVFQPLDDNAEIHIKGGEIFVSHVRQGGSS